MAPRRKLHWYAVWLNEYPDEGSVHVSARGPTHAKLIACGLDRMACELPDVTAVRVTDAEHEAWLEVFP